MADLLKANINEMITRAEDPEKVLNQAIQDMRRQLVEAKGRVALAIADEKRLQKQLETERKKAEEWEKKAMSAVRASRDDLAVEALAKKKQHEALALQFERQYEDQEAAVAELKKALTALNAKIDEASQKKALLVARAKRAEAQRAIAQTMSMAKDRSAFESFERMTEKVDRLEAEAEAELEIAAVSTGRHEDQLAEKIRLLEAGPVSEDLEELKRKMGLLGAGAPQLALEAKSSAADASDASAPAEAGDQGPPVAVPEAT